MSRSPEWRQWYREMMMFWMSCDNAPYWDGSMFSLMLRLSSDNPGHLDWEQVMPVIFQKIMMHLQLPVYYKKIAVMLRPTTLKTGSIARWIVVTISPRSTSLRHLDTLMKAVNSYFHTTSEGVYSEKLCSFFSQVR